MTIFSYDTKPESARHRRRRSPSSVAGPVEVETFSSTPGAVVVCYIIIISGVRIGVSEAAVFNSRSRPGRGHDRDKSTKVLLFFSRDEMRRRARLQQPANTVIIPGAVHRTGPRGRYNDLYVYVHVE